MQHVYIYETRRPAKGALYIFYCFVFGNKDLPSMSRRVNH